jgi:signal transduction histidine kinase
MSQTPSNSTQEIGSILGRVNLLGAATEKLFGRIYKSLNRRAKANKREQRKVELKERIATAKQIHETNKYLRKGLEKRTREIERMHGILARIDEGIIMQDNEGRIAYSNRAARDMLGNQKNFWESELGVLFENYSQMTDLQSELEPLGEPTRVQVNNRVLGAQLAAVANDKGERLGTMIVLRDATRDALADRLKDQFVTAISHELKTPMTVIKGMSEVLMGSPDDQPPNPRLLQTLSRNVDILDRMVVELLDVSEMSAGTFDIRQDEIMLEALLVSVANGLEPAVIKKSLELTVMLRDPGTLKVRGDEKHLRWALGHLLQNAINYNLAGGKVTFSATTANDNPDQVIIAVEDTGVGISDRDMPHIYERFYRGDPRDPSGRLVDPRGLGQGLFIARIIVEAHGGYVSTESQLGEGSLFKVVLPLIPM